MPKTTGCFGFLRGWRSIKRNDVAPLEVYHHGRGEIVSGLFIL